MIPWEQALKLILDNTRVLPPRTVRLEETAACVLAEAVRANVGLPLFSSSARDGFALRSEDVRAVPVSLKLKGTIQAGQAAQERVSKGEAVKIMTGAPLPQGADAVVMVEDSEERDGSILVRKRVEKGENVRLLGEEIKRGQVALPKGAVLNPPSIGFLAALECRRVRVYRRPRVSLLVTGNELIPAGKSLKPGEIWESNSLLLKLALAEIHLQPVCLGIARDDRNEFHERIERGLRASDVLLISGGISVREYDLVQDVLREEKVRKIFWRVAVKPGKPMFFGMNSKRSVFGLPGNPVSSLLSYLEFVRPALLKMMGRSDVFLPEKEAVLEEKIVKRPGRLHFVRGIYEEKQGSIRVKSSGLQDSHVLESFSRANCLILLDRDRTEFAKGSSVRIQLLPW